MSNIAAIGLAIASLGIFFGYISPTYGGTSTSGVLKDKSVRELREEIANYDDALSKAHDIEERLSGLLSVYNSITSANKEKLLKLLPDHIDSVRLIIDINNIASRHGLTLQNITLADDTSKSSKGPLGPSTEKYSKVTLRFGVSGSYESFRSFLEDVERNLRLVDVDTIGFASKWSEGSKSEYDFGVVLATYRLE
jgi:Tfp pilus assembly protein PilO